jgi:purine-cytosine permease-like protein
MGLVILRCVFLLVAAGVSISLANSGLFSLDQYWKVGTVVGGVMSIALAVLTLDMFVHKKRLDAITAVYFGMVVGLFLTYILGLALVLVIPNNENLRNHLQLTLGLVVCYVCISLLMQTRNDFRFIIPYVEFVKD